jgi:hypothetical protein
MRYVRRAIAILIGFAAGFIATSTAAYAALTVSDPAVAPADPASTSAAGLPLWQFLAFVALVVLTAAIVSLGYSRSHSHGRTHP